MPPKIAHFCGHRPAQDGAGGRFPEREISRVRGEIAEILDREDVRFGVGSLAAGADILVAEALLDRDGQVEIVLPFAKDEFIEMSVRVPGRDWIERFEAVLNRAAAIHFVTEDAYLGHDELFNYATHLALGQARLRAERNGAE